MKLPRRTFLHLAAGAVALPAVSRIARAQTYPTRPARLIVGFFAGGLATSSRACWLKRCQSVSGSSLSSKISPAPAQIAPRRRS